jgi:hypothetical protein
MNRLVDRGLPARIMRALPGLVLILFSAASPALALPSAAGWNELLQQHVRVIDDGHASQVDYAGMRRDQARLDSYTRELSAVTMAQFDGWNRHEQMSFLINAYNAFTVQLVLTRWPKLDSIKDLGSLFSSPWKKDFFVLLGQRSDLDQIETRLRGRKYADPRIHFALNCASISCPMLRPEAYVGERLDRQLDDAMNRFLGDPKRNHYDPRGDTLQVSKIFDWYAGDFRHAPCRSAAGLLALHAAQLSDAPQIVARIRAQQIDIDYLPYHWDLNGLATP